MQLVTINFLPYRYKRQQLRKIICGIRFAIALLLGLLLSILFYFYWQIQLDRVEKNAILLEQKTRQLDIITKQIAKNQHNLSNVKEQIQLLNKLNLSKSLILYVLQATIAKDFINQVFLDKVSLSNDKLDLLGGAISTQLTYKFLHQLESSAFISAAKIVDTNSKIISLPNANMRQVVAFKISAQLNLTH